MRQASEVDATVTIHDNYQIELKLNYPLRQGTGKTFYEVGLYLFAPTSLGINPGTYTKQQFYTDLQTYIRVKTPSIPLSRIDNGETSPLGRLRAVIEGMARRPSRKAPALYESQIKLFSCILKSAVRDYVAYIYETTIAEDREHLVDNYIRDIQRITSGYRDLRALIQLPGFGKRMAEIYLFGDEYISLLIEDYTYHLVEGLSACREGLGQERQKALMALIDAEVQYRSRRGYLSIPDETKDNETLVFRRSVLKKYMATVLFLEAKVKKGGIMMEQTLFGMAAGLAMLFATTVAFISQSIYGNLTAPFFVVLVVSYIFKDRMKDLLRYYLSRKVTRFIFDYKTRIYNVARHVVGVCRESFEFIRRQKLAPEIRKLRDCDHITEIENGWVGEQTFLYRKKIRLHPDWKGSIFSEYEIDGVHDIMRFNIQEFLRKMDDPNKELFVMDDDGYHRIKGARVYHLNLIITLIGDQFRSYIRYRLILNRKGIKRIEKVRII
ncbi:MAG TPA: hypothetical protein P5244_12405 [Syntrophales bacterium]|nr:hypothetical protein [Syntrophales bacterium]